MKDLTSYLHLFPDYCWICKKIIYINLNSKKPTQCHKIEETTAEEEMKI